MQTSRSRDRVENIAGALGVALLVVMIAAMAVPAVSSANLTRQGYAPPGPPSHGGLPFTGFDILLAGGFGAGLLCLGIGLRLLTRRA